MLLKTRKSAFCLLGINRSLLACLLACLLDGSPFHKNIFFSALKLLLKICKCYAQKRLIDLTFSLAKTVKPTKNQYTTSCPTGMSNKLPLTTADIPMRALDAEGGSSSSAQHIHSQRRASASSGKGSWGRCIRMPLIHLSILAICYFVATIVASAIIYKPPCSKYVAPNQN